MIEDETKLVWSNAKANYVKYIWYIVSEYVSCCFNYFGFFLCNVNLFYSNSSGELYPAQFLKPFCTLIRAWVVLEVGFVVTGCWSLIESRIGRWVDCEVVVSGSTLEVAEVITDEALGGSG